MAELHIDNILGFYCYYNNYDDNFLASKNCSNKAASVTMGSGHTRELFNLFLMELTTLNSLWIQTKYTRSVLGSQHHFLGDLMWLDRES